MTRLQELETVVKALFAVPDQSVGLTGDQSKVMNKYLARMSGLGGMRMLTSLAMLAGLRDRNCFATVCAHLCAL